jgi:cytochrome c
MMSNRLLPSLAIAFALSVSTTAFAQEHGTADEAVALVKKATAQFKAAGTEKACAAFADPAGGFQSKDLYVFVQDLKGTMICHGKNPGLNTKDLSNLKDPEGKAFVAEMMKVASEKGSGWVDYKWVNAMSKKIEPKSSYVERSGDIFIGAGIYKN